MKNQNETRITYLDDVAAGGGVGCALAATVRDNGGAAEDAGGGAGGRDGVGAGGREGVGAELGGAA